MARAMKKKPAKTVKAWGVLDSKMRVVFVHHVRDNGVTIMHDGDTLVRGTFTYTPPAKPRKR